jgi:hypothetical protein
LQSVLKIVRHREGLLSLQLLMRGGRAKTLNFFALQKKRGFGLAAVQGENIHHPKFNFGTDTALAGSE